MRICQKAFSDGGVRELSWRTEKRLMKGGGKVRLLSGLLLFVKAIGKRRFSLCVLQRSLGNSVPRIKPGVGPRNPEPKRVGSIKGYILHKGRKSLLGPGEGPNSFPQGLKPQFYLAGVTLGFHKEPLVKPGRNSNQGLGAKGFQLGPIPGVNRASWTGNLGPFPRLFGNFSL